MIAICIYCILNVMHATAILTVKHGQIFEFMNINVLDPISLLYMTICTFKRYKVLKMLDI